MIIMEQKQNQIALYNCSICNTSVLQAEQRFKKYTIHLFCEVCSLEYNKLITRLRVRKKQECVDCGKKTHHFHYDFGFKVGNQRITNIKAVCKKCCKNSLYYDDVKLKHIPDDFTRALYHNHNSDDFSFYCFKCKDFHCSCCYEYEFFECHSCGYAFCFKDAMPYHLSKCPHCNSKYTWNSIETNDNDYIFSDNGKKIVKLEDSDIPCYYFMQLVF